MFLRLAASVLAFSVVSVHAATFTVMNNNDAGGGSLRDAIAQANVSPPPNTVNFDPSVTGTIVLTSATINIKNAVSIVGPGAAVLTIDGNANNRIFLVLQDGTTSCPAQTGPSDFLVSISGLTLANAHRNTDNTGGAISTFNSLAVDSVVIRDNAAKAGAGISFLTQYPGQSLSITNSQFTNNLAKPLTTVTSNHQGGAIRIAENCGGGTINTAIPVTVTIANSVFSGNRVQPVALSGQGGAIWSFAQADISISDSRIVDNHIDVPNPPVAGQSYQGGGIRGYAKSLTISRSEISDNIVFDATASDQTRGGALHVFNQDPSLQAPADAMAIKIVNSTISGNSVSATAGAMLVSGNVAVEFDNSTVSNNAAATGRTGGILISTGATSPPSAGNAAAPTLKMVSSILADSVGTTADLSGNATTIPTIIVDATNSLIETICIPSPTCSTISASGSGNLMATDPMLGPLALNGGATRTQALLAGSPAIDAGSNPLALVTDQRGTGFPRVVGPAADMGAYEFNAALPPVFQAAVSRKVHGAAGTFDLPLSAVATNPTTEPRQGPAQTIVFTFDKPISAATVTIPEGAATAAAPTFIGNDVVVALTGVTNQQYVTVSLANVASADGGTGGSASARLGFLTGDVNGSRVVSLADLGLVNAQLAQPVTQANYLKDVNANGTVTLADKGITNANLTKALGPP